MTKKTKLSGTCRKTQNLAVMAVWGRQWKRHILVAVVNIIPLAMYTSEDLSQLVNGQPGDTWCRLRDLSWSTLTLFELLCLAWSLYKPRAWNTERTQKTSLLHWPINEKELIERIFRTGFIKLNPVFGPFVLIRKKWTLL